MHPNSRPAARLAPLIGMAPACACLLLAGVPPASANDAAWQALQGGGHVVLMRHAMPEQGPGKGDARVRDASCAKERRLSPRGKQQAARVGAAFKRRAIPVGAVWASPYCRTMETAKIAFGQAAPAEFLSLSEVQAPADIERHTETAMEKIGSHDGTQNLVMVTHEPNIAAITFELIEQGAFLVLKPRGGKAFDLVGKVSPEDSAD